MAARSRRRAAESAELGDRHIPLRSASSWSMLVRVAKRLSRRAFQNCTLEEVRSAFTPETQRIEKDEFAKILLSDKAILDQFVGFFQNLVHVYHVEVANIRAQECLKASLIRIDPRVESPCIDRIVSLAAEIKVADEQFANIFGALDAARGEIIEVLDVPGCGCSWSIEDRAAVELVGQSRATEAFE